MRDINVITLLNFALYYHPIAPLSAATKSLGVTVDRIMTDNGRSYRSKIFAWAFKQFGIKYLATKPYTPQTNGKAERLIQSALRGWGCATAQDHSDQRHSALPLWLHRHN